MLTSCTFLALLGSALAVTETWPRSVMLHAASEFTFKWRPRVDVTGRWHFALRARTRGYIGFGLSETGTMAGADLLITWAENETQLVLMDLYAAQNGLPGEDDHADWRLEGGSWIADPSRSDGLGILSVHASRRLDTGDQQDLPIRAHTAMFVLYCWGEHREVEYHGSSQRGALRLHLLEDGGGSYGVGLTSSISSHLLPLALLAASYT